MRKLRQTSKVKMGEGGVKSMITYTKDWVTLNAYMCTQRHTKGDVGRIEKSVIRSAHTKCMAQVFCALVQPSSLEGKCFLPS